MEIPRKSFSQMQPNSILAIAPSFSSYSSAQFAEIAAKVIREIRIEEEEKEEREILSTSDSVPEPDSDPPQQHEGDDAGSNKDEDEEDNDDFEFTFVCQDPDSSTISADEIFSNGQIRPIFPIFNRDLIVEGDGDSTKNQSASIRLPLRKMLINGRDSSPVSSSLSSTSSLLESDALSGVPRETFCVWTPKSAPPATPDRCKKSNSTGSSKRWRFRDLLHRSSSDGKETFVFLSASAMKRGGKTEASKEKSNSLSSSSYGKGKAAASAHELHYVRNRKMREGDRHRSYLPYRQDLVGFFANVNGLSRTFQPI